MFSRFTDSFLRYSGGNLFFKRGTGEGWGTKTSTSHPKLFGGVQNFKNYGE